jgi:hypothetical protein
MQVLATSVASGKVGIWAMGIRRRPKSNKVAGLQLVVRSPQLAVCPGPGRAVCHADR